MKRIQTSLEDFHNDLKERQREVNALYSTIHPFVFFPYWMREEIPKEDRKRFYASKGEKHEVREVDIGDTVRIFYECGLEIRLRSLKAGLFVSYWYHAPEWAGGSQDLFAFISEPKSHQAKGIIPWEKMNPDNSMSAHERMALKSEISRIKDGHSPEAKTHYAASTLTKSLVIRYPHADLFITTGFGREFIVHTGPIENLGVFGRMLDQKFRSFSVLKGIPIQRAARKLSDLYVNAPMKIQLRHSVIHTLNNLSGLISNAAGFLMKVSRTRRDQRTQYD